MTKKEIKINERYIGVMEHLNVNGNTRIIKNFNEANAHAYGIIGNMEQTFKLAKEYWLADTSSWGEYFLTAGEIVGDFDVVREHMEFMTFIKKSDILYIWKNRYVVLKKGGVFDLANEVFWKKAEFLKAKDLWEKNVVNHTIWEIHYFDTFGMSCIEYWNYQVNLKVNEAFMEELYQLLDEEEFREEVEFNEYRNYLGSTFKIEKVDIGNETIDFSFNGERFDQFKYEDAYWYIQSLILTDYENKIKESENKSE